MFSSIFRKQFIVYIGTLAVSFIILGASLSQAFKSYFTNQKEKMLVEQGRKIASFFQDSYESGYIPIDNKFLLEVKNLSEFLEASFIFIGKGFEIEAVSSDISHSNIKILNQKELLALKEGNIITIQGKLSGIFKEAVLTVGYPVIIDGEFIGGILMNSSIPALQKSISDVYRITLFCLLASGIVAFVLIYISSKNISKPLLEMNQVAKIIANGDFEKRIIVKSKDEVGQLANSFNYMAESLEKQETQRRDFISNISHDLRSPLTSISGFLQALLDGTIPYENQNKYLNIILDETKRLSKLANDILDINKIQIMELKINKTNFDINELIRKTVIQFEKRVTDKKIEMEVDFADSKNMVFADVEKIQRVIYNVLDNAVKFTEDKGKIKIETTVKDEKVYVSIKDNGFGIDNKQQKHVFERFYKGDMSRGIDKKGSGLGLSIVREFIKVHDENVYLYSEKSKGTEIIFTLAESKETEI